MILEAPSQYSDFELKRLFQQQIREAKNYPTILCLPQLAKLVSLWNLDEAKRLYVKAIDGRGAFTRDAAIVCIYLAAIDEELAFKKLIEIGNLRNYDNQHIRLWNVHPQKWKKYYSFYSENWEKTSINVHFRFAQFIIDKDPFEAAKLHREAFERWKNGFTSEGVEILLKC